MINYRWTVDEYRSPVDYDFWTVVNFRGWVINNWWSVNNNVFLFLLFQRFPRCFRFLGLFCCLWNMGSTNKGAWVRVIEMDWVRVVNGDWMIDRDRNRIWLWW